MGPPRFTSIQPQPRGRGASAGALDVRPREWADDRPLGCRSRRRGRATRASRRDEAPGRSPLYADWAAGVAGDAGVGGDPRAHPGDASAAAARLRRHAPARRARAAVHASWARVAAPRTPTRSWPRRRARSLQTNEPQRCAALLPALSERRRGRSRCSSSARARGCACIPDRYSYRYRGGASTSTRPTASRRWCWTCEVTGDPPLRMPEVVWRAGIDLAPLDAADPADRRFLTTLVWPGEAGRASADRGGARHRGGRPAAADRRAMPPTRVLACRRRSARRPARRWS